MTKRFSPRLVAAFLTLTFTLAFLFPAHPFGEPSPAETLRPAALPESVGLEELEKKLEPSAQLSSVGADLEQFAAKYVKDWDKLTGANRGDLLKDLGEIEGQLDESLQTLADYAQNPDAFHGQEKYKLNLIQATDFLSPKADPLLNVPDWFFTIGSTEEKALREELRKTVFILASGGGGKRFKKGVRDLKDPAYLEDLVNTSRFEKPTALVHVSGKSPEVRFLEGLDRIARMLKGEATVVLVDSPETRDAVRQDLESNAPWLKEPSSSVKLIRGETIVYPSFEAAQDSQAGNKRSILTYRDEEGRLRVVRSANGTFGALEAAWKKNPESDRQYLVVYGDDPALSTPAFLISLLRKVEEKKRSGQGVDFLALATTKKGIDNPRGGTLVDVTIGGRVYHHLMQPGERPKDRDWSTIETGSYFPFDTGTYFLSGRFLQTAIEKGVPLRNSPRELEIDGNWTPVFLPEKYLTRAIDFVNDPGLNFSFEVSVVPLDDGTYLSTYRAMKQYRDEQFGIQGVVDATRTLRNRDKGILRRVFEAQSASDRLLLGPAAAVEISPRVSAIQIGPRGRITVSGRVGIEFTAEGIRARKGLKAYAKGHPRFSRDYVEILPAKEGVITIDKPLRVTPDTVRHLGGLEEFWAHFWPDPVGLDLKQTKIFLPLRGRDQVSGVPKDKRDAVFTPDDLMVTAKTVKILNDRGVDPFLLVHPNDQEVLDEFEQLTEDWDLRYTAFRVDTEHNKKLTRWDDSSQEFQRDVSDSWKPVIVESFSRMAGFRVPGSDLEAVSWYMKERPLVVGIHGFTDFTDILLPDDWVGKANTVDLYHEWRWADYFARQRGKPQVLTGFLYDTQLLKLAEELRTEGRSKAWKMALENLKGYGLVEESWLSDKAYRIFHEVFPAKVKRSQDTGPLERLLQVVDQGLTGRSEDEKQVILFTNYTQADHHQFVTWHRNQGHHVIDLSGEFQQHAPRAPPGNAKVIVVNLPSPIPLVTQRRLMAASNLSVISYEHSLADALYLAYRLPKEETPLILFAGLNAAQMAPLTGPLAIGPSSYEDSRLVRQGQYKNLDDLRTKHRRQEAVETLKDHYAFEELHLGRVSGKELGRLILLVSDLKERSRYLREIGGVILSNGKEELGVDEKGNVVVVREGDPALLNGLNVIVRIIERWDQGMGLPVILKTKRTWGASPQYRDPTVEVPQPTPSVQPGGQAQPVPQAQPDFEQGSVYAAHHGDDPSSADSDQYDVLDRVLTNAMAPMHAGLPSIDQVRQLTATHLLHEEPKADRRLRQRPTAELLGKGGSFRVYELPGTNAVLKHRYIHYAPAGEVDIRFEFEHRYHHIRNTIRSAAHLGRFGVPEQVWVTKEAIQGLRPEHQSELRRYQKMGLLKVADDPLQVTIRFKRRGLEMEDFEEKKAELHTFVLQKRVLPLDLHLQDLVRRGESGEAKRLIDKYIEFIHLLWRHGIFVSDLGVGAIAVEGEELKVFDAGGMPPLSRDARLPDLDELDYPQSVPALLSFMQKKVEGELKYNADLQKHFQEHAKATLTLAEFNKQWGQDRSELEEDQVKAVRLNRPLHQRDVAEAAPLVNDPAVSEKERLDAAQALKGLIPRWIEPARVEVDLQLHTMHSDGNPTPTAVVYEAYRRGLKAIAITDHFTLDGIPEALEAGEIFGVEVIPGVELDTTIDGVEFLGYFPQITNPAEFEQFLQAQAKNLLQLGELQQAEIQRAQAIFDETNETIGKHGYPLTQGEVEPFTRGGPMLPGNVYEAFKAKYGEEIKSLVKKLSDAKKVSYWEGAYLEPQPVKDIYDKYDRTPEGVIQEGVIRKGVIQYLRSIGAVPVLAHPAEVLQKAKKEVQGVKVNWTLRDLAEAISQWSHPEVGLKGIEVNSSKSSPPQMKAFKKVLDIHNREFPSQPLIGTVGSDSHGQPNRVLGLGEVNSTNPDGNLVTSRGTYAVVEDLKRVASGLEEGSIDMHVGTFFSEGSQSPSAVVFEASRRGMKAIGVTGRNTFEHFEEAIRAGGILGITVSPAIELDFVDPKLWTTTQDGDALIYFPARLEEWEVIRSHLESLRGIDPGQPQLNIFELTELRLKWNLMRQYKIIERFNVKYGPRGLKLTPEMLRFRMGAHPSSVRIAGILKSSFSESQLKKGIEGVMVKGKPVTYDPSWDDRELAERIIHSDPEVYVDFNDSIFDPEVQQGTMKVIPGTTDRLFGVSAEVLGQLKALGGVLVLPTPKEVVRFRIDPEKINWQAVEEATGMNKQRYLAKFPPAKDGKVWITPALLKKYHFDGIELSGKKGEVSAREIRELLDSLGIDPAKFLVTVGSFINFGRRPPVPPIAPQAGLEELEVVGPLVGVLPGAPVVQPEVPVGVNPVTVNRSPVTATTVGQAVPTVTAVLRESSFFTRTAEVPGVIQFFVDTRLDPRTLRLAQLAAVIKAREGWEIEFAGVAREGELEALLAELEGDIGSQVTLENRIVTYEEEASYEAARLQALTRLPAGVRIITRISQETLAWFDQAIQAAGLRYLTEDLRQRVEALLEAA